MALSEERKEYLYEYKKAKLKRIPLDVPKEKYEEIKDSAASSGEKVNGYIKAAIDEKMSTVTIPLAKAINTNNELQEQLENALLENSDFLTGYCRESCTDGTARLILEFKSKSHISPQVINIFQDILKHYDAINSATSQATPKQLPSQKPEESSTIASQPEL